MACLKIILSKSLICFSISLQKTILSGKNSSLLSQKVFFVISSFFSFSSSSKKS
jgi:hypothetical protein